MLSILSQATTWKTPNGVKQTLSFMPGATSDLGKVWHISAGRNEYKVELPFFDEETQLVHFRRRRYGLANLALPNCNNPKMGGTPILARYSAADLKAMRTEHPQAEDWELVALMEDGPEDWGYDNYEYQSGMELAKHAILSILQVAFDPEHPAKPQWLEERLLREIRSGSSERSATTFYLVDDSKPRDADRVQRTVLFQDRELVELWLHQHGRSQFLRSRSFAGRLDFLATQGDDAAYKSFMIDGISIEKGALRGHSKQTMMGTTWCCPFGSSVDPVRAGIIGIGNKHEALKVLTGEHGWVEHNPQGEDRIDFLDASAYDTIEVPGMLPGINANVGLCTWPQWLTKDGVIVSESFAARAQHQVPQGFSFWTSDEFEFRSDNPDLPPSGVIQPGQVICTEGGRDIMAPEDLLKGAVIDMDNYRKQISYCQDTTRPIIWFFRKPNQPENAIERRMVMDAERQMTAEQFLAARGMEGQWQLVRLPEQRLVAPGETIACTNALQARPYNVQIHHQMLFLCNVPLVTGCKISTRTGSYKGVVRVVADSFMPHVERHGRMVPLDMLIAQENIPSRGIALALLGEMAVGKHAQNNMITALVGRDVTREQILELAGEEAKPEELSWPSWMAQVRVGSSMVESRIVADTLHWGESTEYAVAIDGALMTVNSDDLEQYENGELFRSAVPHITMGTTGPLFVMIMNRHPEQVAGIRPTLKRNNAGLIQRGDGCVALGLNEFQVMRSLGMSEAADTLSHQDAEAANYARELAESLLGGIYEPEANEMTELEQTLQAHGLSRTDMDRLNPNLMSALAAVAEGKANGRRSRLIQGGANAHWQFTQMRSFQIDPSCKSQEVAWRNELGATLRYGLYLQENWPWKMIAEIEDGAGGSFCTFQRIDEGGTVRAQVDYHKIVNVFETRTIPVVQD